MYTYIYIIVKPYNWDRTQECCGLGIGSYYSRSNHLAGFHPQIWIDPVHGMILYTYICIELYIVLSILLLSEHQSRYLPAGRIVLIIVLMRHL